MKKTMWVKITGLVLALLSIAMSLLVVRITFINQEISDMARFIIFEESFGLPAYFWLECLILLGFAIINLIRFTWKTSIVLSLITILSGICYYIAVGGGLQSSIGLGLATIIVMLANLANIMVSIAYLLYTPATKA